MHVPKYFMEDLFMNEFENTKVTENEDAQDWNPDLMNEEEHTTDTFWMHLSMASHRHGSVFIRLVLEKTY